RENGAIAHSCQLGWLTTSTLQYRSSTTKHSAMDGITRSHLRHASKAICSQSEGESLRPLRLAVDCYSPESLDPHTTESRFGLNQHRRTEPVRPWRAFEKSQFNEHPDRADDRDKADEHPPAGFVTVVKALDIDEDDRDQRDQREDAAEKSEAQLRIVVARRHVYESQQNFDSGQRQDEPEPKLLSVYATFR